jgi:hypothetical protein
MKADDQHILMPGEPGQVNYWSKRWGVSKAEINEAIINTGSLRVSVLRSYFKSRLAGFSFASFFRLLRLSF